MFEKIKDLWVAALRSGDYKQHKKRLTSANRSAHCCMGVLCEVAIKEGVRLHIEKRLDKSRRVTLYYSGMPNTLPPVAMKWAGMRTSMGAFQKSIGSLVQMNDSGDSFEKIADVIEKRWKEL